MTLVTSFRILFGAAVLSGAAAPSLAHDGPRVWFDVAGSNIYTLASDNDLEPSTYWFSKVFRAEFGNFAGIRTTDFPGFEVRRDAWGVQEDAVFRFRISGPLLFYDTPSDTYRTVQSAFGSSGPVPQVNLSLGFDSVTSASAPVDGFDFFTFAGEGTHSHIYFTLLGDGEDPTSAVTDGVYALPMQIYSDGLNDSPVFYVLLGQNVSTSSHAFDLAFSAAFGQLALPIVPEPSGVGLLPLSGLLLLGRRRARNQTTKGTSR